MKSISISSFAAILLIWTITACSPSNRVTGSNNYITKQIKVEKFNGLQLTGSSGSFPWCGEDMQWQS